MVMTAIDRSQKKAAGKQQKQEETRMWADVQHDGRPVEYRWSPLPNAAVWLMPTARVP